MTSWYRVGHSVISARRAEVENFVRATARQRLAENRNAAVKLAILAPHLGAGETEKGPLRIRIVRITMEVAVDPQQTITQRLLCYGFSIEPKMTRDHLHRITGETNHPLDEILTSTFCISPVNKHDVSTCRRSAEQTAVLERQQMETRGSIGPAIWVFADDQVITDLQCRHHRFRGDIEWFRDGAVDAKHKKEDEEPTGNFRSPAGVLRLGLCGGL